MRNCLKVCIFATLMALVFTVPALADQVEVVIPKEEGVSPMGLRTKALSHGFAQALAKEARGMFVPALSEERIELLQQYFVKYGEPYVQGYKILSSQETEENLAVSLDVRVNRKTLRDGLKRMGLFATARTQQAASVVWPADVTDEEMLSLQGLILLTGLEPAADVKPAFTLERTDEGKYKGRLVLDDREWLAIDEDMAKVWFDLWPRFFTRTLSSETAEGGQLLTVTGWFSADGVLEFDRVLSRWEGVLQSSNLLEMDMQAAGVGATWDVQVTDGQRLSALLENFLPPRGLTYRLHKVGTADAPAGETVE